MKVALIFRGEHIRKPEECLHDQSRKYIDALICWNNWKATLINDLKNKGNQVDIIFITYYSDLLEKLKETMNPKHVELYEKTDSLEIFEKAIDFMIKQENEYDRFLILRFDVRYRVPITSWPKWNEQGVFMVNRDVNWNSIKVYDDIVFPVDKGYCNLFKTAYYETKTYYPLRGLGTFFYQNKIPFQLMYEDGYHILEHPLHSLASKEDEPDLDNPYKGNIVVHANQFNKPQI